jgi:dinuclear metal center YbgI/SA1388 family protein
MSQRKDGRSTVADVCGVLETLAPLELAEPWDNVGLLAGDRRAVVRRALLCIDLMPAVVAEALRRKVQLVVAYHPPIFRPLSRLTAPGDGTEPALIRCIERGIAIYSPHSALDAAEQGTNDVLARLSGLRDVIPLLPRPERPRLGMGRVGRFEPPIELGALVRRLKRATSAGCVSVVGEAETSLRRAIVGVGAAGALAFALELGRRDVVITGEMRHHDALRIQRAGASAIALSHWSSERPALASLAERLRQRLAGVEVLSSQADGEPFRRA